MLKCTCAPPDAPPRACAAPGAAVDICGLYPDGVYPNSLNQALANLVGCNDDGQVSAVYACTGSGTLPASLGQLTALTYLSPGTMYGTIPASLSQLTRLQVLLFGGQYYYVSKLQGTLPSLSGMTDLRFLDVSGNSLSGTLAPDMFAAMSRLEYVDFHGGNKFSGSLPPSLLNLPALRVIDLGGNSFTGALPASNAPSLQYLNFRDNSFSGSLSPAFLAGITSLSGLYLGNNALSGTLPDLSVLTSLSSVAPSQSQLFALDTTGLPTSTG